MTLRPFIDDTADPDCTIAVVSDDEPGPLAGMLEETFETQSIDIRSERDVTATPAFGGLLKDGVDTAVLLEDGDVVAASPMMNLYESILAINSDLFVTGARGLGDIDLPDVLAGLEDTRLRLRGYPLAHKEKLLLILVSRFIEQTAWNSGHGTIRSSFQQLSRIDDEIGTRTVYEKLAASDVDVHVYGVGDDTGIDLDVSVHRGTTPTYRDGWFVVYRPDESTGDGEAAALVCLETEPGIWEGFWTTDPERIAAIDDTIAREL